MTIPRLASCGFADGSPTSAICLAELRRKPTRLLRSWTGVTCDMYRTSTLIDLMVEGTNRYALACLGEKFELWTAVNADELCAYMGLLILMVFVKLPSLRDYWKKDKVFNYPPIANVMSRDRFLEIHRYLHFTNNEALHAPGSPGYDKLGKIKPIITALSERFRGVYEPGKNISIDEAMIRFKGRSTIKQYLPMKPIKRGIKV